LDYCRAMSCTGVQVAPDSTRPEEESACPDEDACARSVHGLTLCCDGCAEGVAVYEVETLSPSAGGCGLHVGVDVGLAILPGEGQRECLGLASLFFGVVDTAVVGDLPATKCLWFPALLGDGSRDYLLPTLCRQAQGVYFAAALPRVSLDEKGTVKAECTVVVPPSPLFGEWMRKSSVKLVMCIVYCLRGKLEADISVNSGCRWVRLEDRVV
jgi:hypothetical protein